MCIQLLDCIQYHNCIFTAKVGGAEQLDVFHYTQTDCSPRYQDTTYTQCMKDHGIMHHLWSVTVYLTLGVLQVSLTVLLWLSAAAMHSDISGRMEHLPSPCVIACVSVRQIVSAHTAVADKREVRSQWECSAAQRREAHIHPTLQHCATQQGARPNVWQQLNSE